MDKPILMRQREGKPGGGKGPLMSEDKSLTVATSNDQVLFQAIPIQDAREVNKQQNGLGIGDENSPAYTLDCASQPAVTIFTQNQRNEVRDLGGIAAALAANVGMKQANYVSITGNVTHALTAEGHDASEDGTGRGTPIIVFQQSSMSGKGTLGVDDDAQVSKPVKTQSDGQMIAVDQQPIIGFQPTDGGFANFNADGQSTTLKASDAAAVATTTIVRRLTPTECERLQGFPDGWTAERLDFKTGTVVQQKDAARYKQMGNAVAVPCVAWLLRRIVAHTTSDDTGNPSNTIPLIV